MDRVAIQNKILHLQWMCEIFYSTDSHVRHKIALNKNHDDTKTVNITLKIELKKNACNA